jgi:hypothetical protein
MLFLTDPSRLTGILRENSSPEIAGRAIEQAKELANCLETESTRYAALRSLVDRVEVTEAAIRILLNTLDLTTHLNIDMRDLKSGEPVLLVVAVELRRLSNQKRLVVPAHIPSTNPDPVLIKAIVKAHRWFNMLKAGEVASLSELASVEHAGRTYASRIVPLAFLAPDITEAILEGRQPKSLSLDRPFQATPLPLTWDAQRTALGFHPR